MALTKGYQKERYQYSAKKINKEILEMEEFLDESEAKVLLYRFLRNNLAFTCEMFLGIDLFPYQELMLRGLFLGDYNMYILSRGAGKSFIGGVYIILECLFNQGVKIGVLAPTFRQSKFILQKAEEILDHPSAFMMKQCGYKKITKGTDMWTLKIGKSTAIALPLSNGEKLRGFRFQRILLDEFLGMPENIFTEVIMPFISVFENPKERQDLYDLETKLIKDGNMKEEDRYEWPSNKISILSSPSYEFQYMYKLYKQYIELITREPKNKSDRSTAYRIIWQMAYDQLPEEMYDKNLLSQAKATLSEAAFNREFGARFEGDSGTFFLMSDMQKCTIPIGESPSVEIIGNPRDRYILSFDPSWAGNETSDDFAIQLGKINEDTNKTVVVHSYGISGAPLKSHHLYFKYLLDNFNIELIIGDYMVGKTFIDSCKESKLLQGYNFELVEGEFDKPEEFKEDLIKFKRSLDPKSGRRVMLRNPSKNWIRFANEELQKAIQHQRILFAAPVDDISSNDQILKGQDIPIDKFKWDNNYEKPKRVTGQDLKNSMLFDFLDHQVTMLETTKIQCSNIEVKTNPQGSQTFDLPTYMKKKTGKDKPRKDSYSALVLLQWASNIYYSSLKVQEEDRVISTFTPFAID